MTAYTQPTNIADVLLVEVQPGWTKDIVTIAASQALAVGQVLGVVTASGQYTTLAPAASDGSQTAAAVCLDVIASSAGTQKAAVISRGAVVDPAFLVWPGGITTPQKTAALAQLKAAGIIPAPSVL